MLPEKIQRGLVERADGLCEYCKSPANISSQPFVADHIFPISKGGKSEFDNLAFSCQGCNSYKYNKTSGKDLITGNDAQIFNPRIQKWANHFSWSEDGLEIIGISSVGRVTIHELKMNRIQLQNLRSLLVNAGLHPPA